MSYTAKSRQLTAGRALLESLSSTPQALGRAGIAVNGDGRRRSAFELLAYPGLTIETLSPLWPALSTLPATIASQLEVDARYDVYIRRQDLDVAQLKHDELLAIPANLDLTSIPGLSTELRQKLTSRRPATLAEAGRIDGMTPAALLVLAARIRHSGRTAKTDATTNYAASIVS